MMSTPCKCTEILLSPKLPFHIIAAQNHIQYITRTLQVTSCDDKVNPTQYWMRSTWCLLNKLFHNAQSADLKTVYHAQRLPCNTLTLTEERLKIYTVLVFTTYNWTVVYFQWSQFMSCYSYKYTVEYDSLFRFATNQLYTACLFCCLYKQFYINPFHYLPRSTKYFHAFVYINTPQIFRTQIIK